MAFIRFYPTRDTFITNLTTSIGSATGSNAGASEILQLFKFGPSGTLGLLAESGSIARILVAFDTSSLPATTGSVQYWLNLFDAQHAESLPYDYTVEIVPLEQAWAEGRGHDIDFFTDSGTANWLSASNGIAWTAAGARPTGTLSATFYFADGHEDLQANVSSIVASATNGFFVALSSTYENDTQDYFLKEFHSRQTHFAPKKPYLEARWADWTGTLTSASFYVVITGTQSGTILPGNTDTADYLAIHSFAFTGSVSGVFFGSISGTDILGHLTGTASGTTPTGSFSSSFTGSMSGTFSGTYVGGYAVGDFTGTLAEFSSTLSGVVLPTNYALLDPTGTVVASLYNLKPVYDASEVVRVRVYSRTKEWDPAVVHTASSDASGTVLMDAYYRVVDDRTEEAVVPFGTGALPYTKMSFDDAGNYFYVRMASFPTGTLLRFDVLYNVSGSAVQIRGDEWKFRVM